jgi:tetratricopeptide (TPR) repeat protein
MGWFSRKKQAGVPGKRTAGTPSGSEMYRMPSASEMAAKLRDIEEVNRRIDEDPGMQRVMREMFGREPAAAPPLSMEQVMENVRSGGLSYLASPPADFPEAIPEAHELWLGEAFLACMQGDDARCLAKFTEILEITRQKGHKPGEARILYNIGVAHYKLGNLDKAVEVLLEGKALTEEIAGELGREARKLQRDEEELKTDRPTMRLFGTPHIEQQLLEMYLKALTTVYEADSQAGKAAGCRDEIKRLYRQGI